MEERAIHSAARDAMADALWRRLGIGIPTGMRSMPTLAALTWAASPGRPRIGWIRSGPVARGLATAAGQDLGRAGFSAVPWNSSLHAA
jgi:hypothetical protein